MYACAYMCCILIPTILMMKDQDMAILSTRMYGSTIQLLKVCMVALRILCFMILSYQFTDISNTKVHVMKHILVL